MEIFRQLDDGGFFIARRTTFRSLQELVILSDRFFAPFLSHLILKYILIIPGHHKKSFQVEHYTRDADGLCVNLRKPCVQVRFPLFSLKFLQNLMKSKLAQFPPVLHGPISGAISGARVSPLGPSASHRAIFISTYISHPRICQPAQWEQFFTPYHLNLW